MSQSQNIGLEQRTVQRLTAQQLRYVKLLELSAPELEQAVADELAENPALESVDEAPVPETVQSNLTDDGSEFRETAEDMQKADYGNVDDIPHYRLEANNFSPDDAGYDFTPADDAESIYGNLERQLSERSLTPKVELTARFIIGSLDSNGYLRRSESQLIDDMAISTGFEPDAPTFAAALDAVRSLDPPGLAARDLRECLQLQARALPPSPERDLAISILDRQFVEFTMKHADRIASHLRVDKEEVRKAIDLILTLNPKPGSALGSGAIEKATQIVPDFIISVDRDQITVALPGSPDLRIEESFAEAVARMERNARSRSARKGKEFVISRFNAARDFIQIVRQRRETLFAVMTAIVKLQRDYFLTQDVHALRPMMIKDISSMTGYDISVVSRATNNKYAATPWGIYPLRFFFSDGLGEEGEEFTNRQVEEEMRDIIAAEDKRHPLSDEKLRAVLVEKGYDVSRRTVAKYRDRLKIPVARLRKEM